MPAIIRRLRRRHRRDGLSPERLAQILSYTAAAPARTAEHDSREREQQQRLTLALSRPGR